jgi:hypothetical protein
VLFGEQKEKEFVEILKKNGYNASINPVKGKNKYAPDLLVDGKLVDLKYQEDFFFKAEEKYGIPPHKLVSVNCSSFERYLKLYPDLIIMWWVNRKATTGYGITTESIRGVWKASVKKLKKIIDVNPITHWFRTRGYKGDRNKSNAYLFNLDQLDALSINF